MNTTWTPLARFLTSIGHQEPDRVPYVLPVMLHGARHLGLGLKEYFSRPQAVVDAQIALRERFGHDAIIAMLYAAQELQAWGGGVRFFDDGPPNAAGPIVRTLEQIAAMTPPRVADCPVLRDVLWVIEQLKARTRGEVAILGAVVSPFSVPVMQLGFEPYLNVLLERRDLFDRLMAVNEAFAVEWGNAQIAAGAHALAYFDPVSSGTIIPPSLYRETGLPVAKRTIARFKGAAAIGLASGRLLPTLDDLSCTGAAGVTVSVLDDLAEAKARTRGRLALLGNLNGIEMRRWSMAETDAKVKDAIKAAGPGGGFVLTDQHGELPWQVNENTLDAVAAAIHRWGRYPLKWVDA